MRFFRILKEYILYGILVYFFFCGEEVMSQGHLENQTGRNKFTLNEQAQPTVSLIYSDTLILLSFAEFDLPVIMKTGNEVAAITLGFYFPEKYLVVDTVVMTDAVVNYHFSVIDSLVTVVWSNTNPVQIEDNDTLITLKMRVLDLSSLTETIRLRINDLSEFTDKSLNTIDSVVLETREIAYLRPDTNDTVYNFNVNIYPNPFRDYPSVHLSLEMESQVGFTVYNYQGKLILKTDESKYGEGDHLITLNGIDFSVGVYYVKVSVKNDDGSYRKMFKMVAGE